MLFKEIEEFDDYTQGFIMGALEILAVIEDKRTHDLARKRLFMKAKKYAEEFNAELKGSPTRAFLTINKRDIEDFGI